MENIIFNELRYRGFSVDVGVVEVSEKSESGGYRRKIDAFCTVSDTWELTAR